MAGAWGSSWATSWGDSWGGVAAPAVSPRLAGRRPVTRQISVRSLVFTIAGPEQSYPAYRFSGRNFDERPNHNPFKDL